MGSNPKGRSQKGAQHQQTRYENQQGPMVSAFRITMVVALKLTTAIIPIS